MFLSRNEMMCLEGLFEHFRTTHALASPVRSYAISAVSYLKRTSNTYTHTHTLTYRRTREREYFLELVARAAIFVSRLVAGLFLL